MRRAGASTMWPPWPRGYGRGGSTTSSGRSTSSAPAPRWHSRSAATAWARRSSTARPVAGRRRSPASSPRRPAQSSRSSPPSRRRSQTFAPSSSARPSGSGRAEPAHDPLPRRDPPLQQGTAGRAPARRRVGPDHTDRGDDGEPVLRGQLGASLARADLRARAAVGRGPGRHRSTRGRAPGRWSFRTTWSTSSHIAPVETPAPH